MRVNEQIRRLLLDWPTLRQTRSQVIENLFCTYGTGFGWQGGEIVYLNGEEAYQQSYAAHREQFPVSDDPEVLMTARLKRHHEEQERLRRYGAAEEDLMSERMLARYMGYWREGADEDAAKTRHVWQNIDQLVLQRTPLQRCFPMDRKGSPLALIPDDARTDWLDAAEEAAELVLTSTSCGIGDPEENRVAVDNNHAIAREAKQRIAAIRSARATTLIEGQPGDLLRARDEQGRWADWLLLDGKLAREAESLGYRRPLVLICRGQWEGDMLDLYEREPEDLPSIISADRMPNPPATWERVLR